MAFSELELEGTAKTVGNLCRTRTPPQFRDELSTEYRIKGHEVLVFERRPAWRRPGEFTESGIAKLKYVRSRNEWRLF